MNMTKEIEIAEVRKITELVKDQFDYDFSQYALSSFRRRIARILELHHIESVDGLLDRLSSESHYFQEFLSEVTVNVTEMFRDYSFWTALKDDVFQRLSKSDLSKIKIWHAGCSSGEEVFSMCILLKEAGLLDRVEIIATDIDRRVISNAKKGLYMTKNMEVNKKNYQSFNPNGDFDQYCTYGKDGVQMDLSLLDNVTFRTHNMITGIQNDTFHLVLCRNVLIYFNQALQNKALKIIHQSMEKNGFLAIGSKESLLWCEYFSKFETISNEEKIFRKIKV